MQFSPLCRIEHQSIDQAVSSRIVKTQLTKPQVQRNTKPFGKMPSVCAGLDKAWSRFERMEADPAR